MVKILRILNRFNIGGPTYNVAYLSKYLPDEYQTKLIGGQREDSEASSEYMLQELNVSYEIIPEIRRKISLYRDFKAFLKVVAIIKEYKPDIVHTHASKAGLIGRLAAFYCHVPYTFHTFHGNVFHSYFGKTKSQFFIKLERFLAKRTTAIIAISKTQKEELSTIYNICPAEKIEIIPLGFDLRRFSENKEEKRKQFRTHYGINDDSYIAVGIIGRLAPVKNHHLFIDAIKKCKEALPHIKIRAFIIGDGETESELMEYCKNQNIDYENNTSSTFTKTITFTSWIREVDYAYAGLDIICLTSRNEGTPVSIIEAQAAGKPIVSTRVGGICDIVEEGKTALLSDISVDEFTNNLEKIIKDPELRKTMSDNCKTFSNTKFSYQRLCTDMDTVYRKYRK